MNVGNALGVLSLVLLAIYALGGQVGPSAFMGNLRGLSLVLIVPLSLVAGWLGSRLWWLVSGGMIVLAVYFFVALSRHS